MIGIAAQGVSKREFLIFLYKYRVKLFFAFMIPFALAIAISCIPTPRYKAVAVLIVRLGSEYVYQPEVSSSGSQASVIPFDHEQIFKSEVAILNSDDLHAQVIEAVGLDNLYPEINNPTGFNLFLSTIKGGITNTMMQWGLLSREPETQEETKQRKLAQAVMMFDKRLDILLEKESAVIDISYENPSRSMSAKALDMLLKLYFDKRKQIYTESRSGMVQAQVEQKRKEVATAEHALEAYKRDHKIFSLDDERDDLLERRSAAQEKLDNISTQGLRSKIAEYNNELNRLDSAEREYEHLQKEAQIAQNSYTLYSGKMDEAHAYDDLQNRHLDSVRIIQPAIAPPEPARLQLLIILAGFFVSVICVLAAAALTEFSKKGFVTPEQIERTLGIPVLGVFPVRKLG
jgi:uncharacterized protein involved in exopolysaccharide biosynthesis